MNKIIDTHAHYTHYKYDKDRDSLISAMHKDGVEKLVEVGTDNKSIIKTIQLAEKYSYIKAIIGYFPTNCMELDNPETLKRFVEQLKNKRVIALGEIGLDYHWDKPSREVQKKMFIKQIDLAKEMNLPICVHSRDAEQDTDAVFDHYDNIQGVIHCFSYGPEMASKWAKKGFYFGVGGTSTYRSNSELRAAIKVMPLNRIVTETDAPFLTAEPYRRERNDSRYISEVIKNIADIKELRYDIVEKAVYKNAFDLFDLN